MSSRSPISDEERGISEENRGVTYRFESKYRQTQPGVTAYPFRSTLPFPPGYEAPERIDLPGGGVAYRAEPNWEKPLSPPPLVQAEPPEKPLSPPPLVQAEQPEKPLSPPPLVQAEPPKKPQSPRPLQKPPRPSAQERGTDNGRPSASGRGVGEIKLPPVPPGAFTWFPPPAARKAPKVTQSDVNSVKFSFLKGVVKALAKKGIASALEQALLITPLRHTKPPKEQTDDELESTTSWNPIPIKEATDRFELAEDLSGQAVELLKAGKVNEAQQVAEKAGAAYAEHLVELAEIASIVVGAATILKAAAAKASLFAGALRKTERLTAAEFAKREAALLKEIEEVKAVRSDLMLEAGIKPDGMPQFGFTEAEIEADRLARRQFLRENKVAKEIERRVGDLLQELWRLRHGWYG